MTFVVSNLYGRLDKFEKLIKKINLKDSDILYVLGNIVDYGDQSIDLVNDLSTRYNARSVQNLRDLSLRERMVCFILLWDACTRIGSIFV